MLQMKSTKIAAILQYISHNIYSTIRPELKMVYYILTRLSVELNLTLVVTTKSVY